jgi:hypothetical protein
MVRDQAYEKWPIACLTGATKWAESSLEAASGMSNHFAATNLRPTVAFPLCKTTVG